MIYRECIPVIAAVVWHILLVGLFPMLGLVKPNYAGRMIPASYGIIMIGYILAGITILLSRNYVSPHTTLFLAITISSLCILGFLDDVFGSRDASGFRGHFKMLFKQGKLTTGAAKALGGGLIGLIIGYYLSQGVLIKWALAALLVPLGANTFNLLDLRPGRAGGVFLAALVLVSIFALFSVDRLAIPVIGLIVFPFVIWDGRGRAMMGDSGSNQLGAALGILIASQTHILFQAAAVAFMLAIQLYSEKHSITALIERNPVLRSIDHKLGVR